MHKFRTLLGVALGAAVVTSCSSGGPVAAPEQTIRNESSPDNILYIGEGAIAYSDQNEDKRHWSEWAINLLEGSNSYGWTSDKGTILPHSLTFELAGQGEIKSFTLDSSFAPVAREDGTISQAPVGAAVRKFTVSVSNGSKDGPYKQELAGELPDGGRKSFALSRPVKARWIKLTAVSNWSDSDRTRLSEFEATGTIANRTVPDAAEISGVYATDYGDNIILRQQGSKVTGCYKGGVGELQGVAMGRLLRLAFLEPDVPSAGAATLVVANGKLYGFWYRRNNQMGSPWHAVKSANLTPDLAKECKVAIL